MLHSIEAFVKPHGVDQEGVTMRQERTREERLKDKAVVLALCARTQLAIGSIGDRLKIQKLCFLVGYPLFEKRVKGLNYTFFTYTWGPFTKDLYEAETDFEEAGLLERQGKIYSLSGTGLALGRVVYTALQETTENGPILQAIDHVVNTFANLGTDALITHTHKMSVIPVGWRESQVLEGLPFYLNLTQVLDDEEANTILQINPDWLDSLGDALLEGVPEDGQALRRMANNPQVISDLKRGIQALKKGSMIDWNEVRGKVGIQ